jgi:hypothetical protein
MLCPKEGLAFVPLHRFLCLLRITTAWRDSASREVVRVRGIPTVIFGSLSQQQAAQINLYCHHVISVTTPRQTFTARRCLLIATFIL